MDPDSKRDDCIQVAGNIARKKVTDAHYEGRVLSIRNWYAEKRKLRMRKDQAREIVNFQPWQYLQVLPFPPYRLGDLVTAGHFSLICVFCAYAVPSSVRRSR
jgi:hypothetical protein